MRLHFKTVLDSTLRKRYPVACVLDDHLAVPISTTVAPACVIFAATPGRHCLQTVSWMPIYRVQNACRVYLVRKEAYLVVERFLDLGKSHARCSLGL
jgi:hypothetical protein